ncbi:Maf family protein [Cytophagaceae bacterium ABcell3]|nr:Maf family protein [Cytophagaceae bacterium ABcell3]
MFIDYPLILASASPRRQQILADAGIFFTIKTKSVPEIYPKDMPAPKVPEFLSKLKADSLKEELNNEVVLAADTIVSLNGLILEKPKDRQHAIEMLSMLSGKMHEVYTGVTILNKEKSLSFSDVSEVYFKDLSQKDIEHYIDNFKPYDKAGAYGIQEWIGMIGIRKINGSFYNVMGLPIHLVIDELVKFKEATY